MTRFSPSESASLAGILREVTLACWAEVAASSLAVRNPELHESSIEGILRYLDCLLLWRSKISLVSTESVDEIVVRHIADSLALAPLVPQGGRVADIGSGAGLPGLPLAIVCPDAEFLLVEPRRKRANFLREASRVTEVGHVAVFESRVEALEPAVSRGLDTIVSRAFGPLADFLEAVEPLTTRGAARCRTVVMKGPRGEDDAAGVANRFGTPGVIRYSLPGRDERILLVYESKPST